jgi:LysR family glycine cleavage system transcriptional activator
MPRPIRIPLHALPAFRAAATLQNLRAAAEALHLTHSAVSQQIRGLEEQLGFEVFERRGRRIVLNAAGEALLRNVEPALALLDDGVQAAAAASAGAAQRLRVTVLPSFAQRWLLPRMGRWRERHPQLALEIEASQQIVDLQRDGFHAAIRSGRGPWPGLEFERLFEGPTPMIVVASSAAARRLLGAQPEATFNDAGLMLQATEQGIGLAITRELLAADALCDGRLVRISPLAVTHEQAYPYHLVYPPSVRDWPPLVALRDWLRDELELSRRSLYDEKPRRRKAGTATAGR